MVNLVILKQLKNKKGQAIVEYVLVLTALVLIFIALMKPFTKGLVNWSNSVFKYYTCLLTSGVLPSDNVNCVIEDFDPGDLSGSGMGGGGSGPGSGSGPGGSGGGPGSGSGPPGGSSNPPSVSDPYQGSQIPPPGSIDSGGSGTQIPITLPGGNSSSGKSSTGDTDSFSNQSLIGGNGSLMPSNNNTSALSQGEGQGGASAGKKNKKLRFRTYPRGFYGYDDAYGGYLTAIHSSGSFSEEKEQKIKSSPIPVSSAEKKNSSFEEKRRSLLKVSKKKKKVKDTEIERWNFGTWIRILFIVCFLIVLILIIGSQTSQVRKSLK